MTLSSKVPTFVELTGAVGQWAVTLDSTSNNPLALSKPLVAGKAHYITAIEVSISGAAAANDITIQLKDGTTTIWKEIIGSGAARGERAGLVFAFPIGLTIGNAANLAVDAGGAGVITTANMAGYTA